MITMNYKKLVLTNIGGTSTSRARSIEIVNVDGSSQSYDFSYSVAYYIGVSFYAVLGSGTTEPTENDYKVESELNNLEIIGNVNDFSSVRSTAITDDNCMYFGKATLTVRNDNNYDVVVNEICGYARPAASNKYTMLCRSVISPVTIHPGEIYVFTCSIGKPVDQ